MLGSAYNQLDPNILFKLDFKVIILFFRFLYNFSELNNIFHVKLKGLNIFTLKVKLIGDRRKTKQEKY